MTDEKLKEVYYQPDLPVHDQPDYEVIKPNEQYQFDLLFISLKGTHTNTY